MDHVNNLPPQLQHDFERWVQHPITLALINELKFTAADYLQRSIQLRYKPDRVNDLYGLLSESAVCTQIAEKIKHGAFLKPKTNQ